MDQQQTIKSLYDDAIKYDEPYTAHYIHFAIMKGKVTFQDTVDKLYEFTFIEEETKEFEQFRASDYLNMRPIKLYAIKCNEHSYAFYFAQNALDARELHYKIYGQWANKINSCYNQMIDKLIYCPYTKQTKSFRESLKRGEGVPWFVGEVGK